MARAGARLLALAATAASALLCARPAAAVPDEPVVLAATAGLTIAVVPGTASLSLPGGSDPVHDPDASQQLTGDLPLTTVTDVRVSGGAFAVTVSATAFTNATDPAVQVAPAAARVYLDAADLPTLQSDLLGLGLVGATVNGAALASTAPDLSSSYTLLHGSTGLLGGTVPYVPTIEVTIPAGTPVGTYTATISQTVS